MKNELEKHAAKLIAEEIPKFYKVDILDYYDYSHYTTYVNETKMASLRQNMGNNMDGFGDIVEISEEDYLKHKRSWD
jgi:hypothetical protein